jgi:hypothetical protein
MCHRRLAVAQVGPRPPAPNPIANLTLWHVWWVGFGLARLLHAFISETTIAETDFYAFYVAASEWRGIHLPPLPDKPNLNPPTFTLLMVPFTYLPLTVAFVLWELIGLTAIIASVRAIHQVRPFSTGEIAFIVGAFGALRPSIQVWRLGQITWLLLYPTTIAWLAHRQSRHRTAAAWLGTVVAVKPTLAMMAIFLPSAIWLRAAFVSVSIVGAAVVMTGYGPWWQWIAAGDRVEWLPLFTNMSLFGLAARLQSGKLWGVRMAELDWWWFPAIGTLFVLYFVRALRLTVDGRWMIAVLGCVFFQPLGWIHNVLLGLGPMTVLGARDFGTRAAIVIFVMPVAFVVPLVADSSVGATLVGSLNFLAGCCLYVSFASRNRISVERSA